MASHESAACVVLKARKIDEMATVFAVMLLMFMGAPLSLLMRYVGSASWFTEAIHSGE